MSVLIKGIDMPEKHHMNGYYISDDGRVFDISRKNVVGKAIQYKREQYNKLEQKKSNWLNMGDFEQCSICGGTHLKEFQSYYGKTKWIKTNYCPNCGADLRGEQDE